MAVVIKRLGKGSLNTGNAVLYTVPPNTVTLVKAMTLCNGGSAPISVSISFANTAIISNHVIKPYDTITIPFLDQVLNAGDIIHGSESAGSFVTYYFSGKEVT